MEAPIPAEGFLISSNDDIFLNVSVFGVYDPKNLHSFSKRINFNIFSIQICSMCSSLIAPFGDILRCASCHCYAHRTCSKSQTHFCPNFGFKGKKERTHTTSFTAYPRDTPTESILMIQSGIITSWDRILKDVSSEFTFEAPIERYDINIIERVERLSICLLGNPLTFPGKVAVICRSIFMLMKFEATVDVARYAKGCLDTISASVLFELEKKYQVSVSISAISNVVEKYILSQFSRSMYKKIMESIASDVDLQIKDEEVLNISRGCELVIYSEVSSSSIACSKLIYSLTALEKCKLFVIILEEAVGEIALGRPKIQSGSETADLASGHSIYDISADELLPQVVKKILQLVRSLSDIKWHAECRYISLMSSQEQWLLGKEGYALATIAQSLKRILASSINC